MYQSLSMYITLLKKDFDNFCNKRLQEIGISQGLMFFIIYVGNHHDCSPKDLSTAIKVDAGHTTRSIEKLVQAGFLTRKVNETDKRAFQLRLTEKGQNAFYEIKNLFKYWDEFVLRDITEEDRKTMFKVISTLNKTTNYSKDCIM